jgi:uncharacterized membrane protein YfcA
MNATDAVVLFAAGLGAGGVNAIAGGGSLISFPTLVALGLPPVAANVSNSTAVCPGYLASVYGSRRDLGDRRPVYEIIPTATAGAIAGCVLLLATPQRAFEVVVPFLVLGAVGALAFQTKLRQLRSTEHPSTFKLHTLVALGSVYGGYFGAALGIMLVAGLSVLTGYVINRVSAWKNIISAVVGLVTVIAFAIFGPVNWAAVALLSPATIIGGYAGARFARRLPANGLRWLIVGYGLIVGGYLMVKAYRGGV